MARPGQEIVNPAGRMRLVFVHTAAETNRIFNLIKL